MNGFIPVVFFVLFVLILWRPYLGIVFIATSLPVVDLLPSIPYLTSIVPLFGIVTLAGLFIQRGRTPAKSLLRLGSVHILGLFFIGWMFISNPQAAWFGTTRNWVLTFLQLWSLIWLTGELLDTPKKHHIFMWVFSIATIISSFYAIQQGRIGIDINTSSRASGLTEGVNSAARYFVVAMVFLNYLRTISNKGLLRLLTIVGMIVTFLGVFFTVSRTGILLVFGALGSLVLINPRLKYRFQLIFVFFISLLILWFLSDNIMNILESIFPSITQGTDTAGLRYILWRAGWRMWLDHVLQGVGIGMFPEQLMSYAQEYLTPNHWHLVTHNMYIQILAETGLIGFFPFMLILIISLRNIWHAGSIKDKNISSLRDVWFVVFLVMLMGGITKSDHYDKMIWLVMGVGVYFQNQFQVSRQEYSFIKETANNI